MGLRFVRKDVSSGSTENRIAEVVNVPMKRVTNKGDSGGHMRHPTGHRSGTPEFLSSILRLPFTDMLPAHFYLLAREFSIRVVVASTYFLPRTHRDIASYIKAKHSDTVIEAALPRLLTNLQYNELRHIQLACFEPIFNGRSCLCLSQTASGKTLMYLLPMLLRQALSYGRSKKFLSTLVLVPTRILCEQVAQVAQTCIEALTGSYPHLSELTVSSVHSGKSQQLIDRMLMLSNVIIATPGVLMNRQYTFNGAITILDEYDELLEGSFLSDILQILRTRGTAAPCSINSFLGLQYGVHLLLKHKEESHIAQQFVFVSATITDDTFGQAKALSSATLDTDLDIVAYGAINKVPKHIQHTYLYTNRTGANYEPRKMPTASSDEPICSQITNIWHLKHLISDGLIRDERTLLHAIITGTFCSKCIVFFLLRARIDEEAARLNRNSNIITLHGDMPQCTREKAMEDFSAAKPYSGAVLFATDLGARGMDSQDVDLIVNIGLPQSPLSFIHRAGRAGRSGNKGLIISVISKSNESAIDIASCFDGCC